MKFIYLAILAIAVFASCKKQDVIVKNEVFEFENKVKNLNGTLSFESNEDFLATLAKINQLSEADFESWEKQIGIKTQYSILIEETNKIRTNDNISDEIKTSVENKYPFLKLYGYSFGLKNHLEGMSRVLNLDGIVLVGENKLQYTDKQVIYSNVKDNNRSVAGQITMNITSSNTTNQLLLSDRFQDGSRRFYCELYEAFQVVPFTQAGSNSTAVYWGKNLFLRFSHQRKRTFGWSNVSSPTYINSITGRTFFADAYYNQWLTSGDNMPQSNPYFRIHNVSNVTLGSAENSFFDLANLNWPVVSGTPTNPYGDGLINVPTGTSTVNLPRTNIQNLVVVARGDGNQPWWTSTHTTP